MSDDSKDTTVERAENSKGRSLTIWWCLGLLFCYFFTQVFFISIFGMEKFYIGSSINALVYAIGIPLYFRENFGQLKGAKVFFLSVIAILTLSFTWTYILDLLGKNELQAVTKRISEIQGWERVPVFISTALLIPLVEEVIFRLGIFKSLKSHIPVWAALILSSFIFAIVHGEPLFWAPLMGLGFIFAYSYEKTKTLWVPIALHAFNNGLTLIDLWWKIF